MLCEKSLATQSCFGLESQVFSQCNLLIGTLRSLFSIIGDFPEHKNHVSIHKLHRSNWGQIGDRSATHKKLSLVQLFSAIGTGRGCGRRHASILKQLSRSIADLNRRQVADCYDYTDFIRQVVQGHGNLFFSADQVSRVALRSLSESDRDFFLRF